MTVSTSVHNVTGIEIEPQKKLTPEGSRDFWIRRLSFRDKDGHVFELTLMGDSEDALRIGY